MELTFLAAAAVTAGIYAWLLRIHPRVAVVLVMAVLVFVPVWGNYGIPPSVGVLGSVFVLIAPAVAVAGRGQGRTRVDNLLIGFTVLVVLSYGFAGTPRHALLAVLLQWVPAYAIGRYLMPRCGETWVYRLIAFVGAFVGAWSIAEFVFNWHIFEGMIAAPNQYSWSPIQSRGPYLRSEAAFGHSIALGGFLAMCAPFVIVAKLRPIQRPLMLALVTGGALVTFSRGAIISIVIALICCTLFLPGLALKKNTRGMLVALLAVSTVTVVPYVLSVFGRVSDDLTASTNYRVLLADYIFVDVRPFGPAREVGDDGMGRSTYRGLTSIDNEFILVAIQYGWVSLLVLVFPLLLAMVRTVKRQGGPADIAIVGQIFLLGTVALITQYGWAVWLFAGMAVGFGELRARASPPAPAESPRPSRPSLR